ncbi:MAG: putative membrane-associated phospholipid phosphatase, PAP2 superfamily [Nitrospira sp.]|jgi:undecaprenyl-diphosphatase|nr:MAG: putative membrane-associated phospholipid phosphatase, PAP2 superfamily [Nitrospira sp.]
MTEPDDGRAAPLQGQPEPAPARPPVPAVVLSVLALIGSFAALLQIDIPILWFLRSHNLSALQRLGDLGEKLGNGGTLVTISLLVLGSGLYLKRDRLRRLGLDSLLAHGVVALLVNGLKHVIGRPRPRLTHSGGWQWWPSLDSGLDSFPSGHTSATVAVVTVLARALPRLRWLPFAIAVWVGASRIWRGSHFPSDVVAGMVMGFVVGSIFNGPLHWWGRSCAQALIRIAPMVLLITGLFWVLTHRIVDPTTDGILLASGAALVAGGLVLRQTRHRSQAAAVGAGNPTSAVNLVGLGLAVATAAPVVIGLAGLVCLARWPVAFTRTAPSTAPPSWRDDCLYAAGAIAALAAIQALKGLVPLQ